MSYNQDPNNNYGYPPPNNNYGYPASNNAYPQQPMNDGWAQNRNDMRGIPNNPAYQPLGQNVAIQQAIFARIYTWMAIGLLLTAAVAIFVVQTPALLDIIYSNPAALFGIIIVELALVIGITYGLRSMSVPTARALFLLYAAVNGLTLALVFLVYTSDSIASTFFVTAGMFAALSFYGFVTKRDLSRIGTFLFMALIGLILASLVNLFLHSTPLGWLITFAGVLIFSILTVYDTQKLKRMIAASNPADQQGVGRLAIYGALRLYLDFINLFLYLLRILGRRR